MSGLLYLTLLVMQCGYATGRFVSQTKSTVRVQPGFPTSLECHVQLSGSFSIFWIKITPNKAPVCVATAQTFVEVTMGEHFRNQSRIKVTWNQKTFDLSFSSVEQADVATYFCGMYSYGHLFFGNGSKLILEEHAGAVSPNATIKDNVENDGKTLQFEYLLPVLAATNVVSIIFIIWLCLLLKKRRSGVTVAEAFGASDNKTDEVNYAALTFGNKQRRTVQKRNNVDSTVIYGAVRHQEDV